MKNTDRFQTLMGLGEAVIVAILGSLASMGEDGLNYESPIFWGSLALSVSRAVKSYYAAGVQTQTKEAV